jgi:dihydroxyacetone kinase-like protein
MPCNDLESALLVAADALEQAHGELNRLDGFAGDGDMGITMSEVARALREAVAGAEHMSHAQLLSSCGAAIARSAPSTSGTLLATGLLRAARALAGPQEEITEAISACFQAAMDGIQARGRASVGDRTMVDGLDAICVTLRESAQRGADWRDALRRAATSARSAADASASMRPQVGRASWVPERAIGHPDAGCTMLAVVLEAVSS